MKIRGLRLDGTFEIVPKIMGDSRGYFVETYLSNIFEENDLQTKWIQENQSLTEARGTIRGLHFQAPPAAQTKLVSVPAGAILDVFVDIRKDSPTYGEWDSIEVSSKRCNAVYIPHGFAHGYCTLTADTIVQYKVDSLYSPTLEGGILWNAANLSIDWGVDKPKLSEKDAGLPLFEGFNSPF